MRKYEDYRLWEGSCYDPLRWELLLRDILAELDEQSSKIEGFLEWIADLDIRITKLEEIKHEH